jgi:hypothetical protein
MPSEQWHLDKKVPIGIIGALFIQTLVFIYVGVSWKEGVDYRISALEKSDTSQSSHENRITILEQKFSYIQTSLDEIKELLRSRQNTPSNNGN